MTDVSTAIVWRRVVYIVTLGCPVPFPACASILLILPRLVCFMIVAELITEYIANKVRSSVHASWAYTRSRHHTG